MPRLTKAERAAKLEILREAFTSARRHKDIGPFIQNKWITSDLLVTALNTVLPTLSSQEPPFVENNLKRQLPSIYPDIELFGKENVSGIAVFRHGKQNKFFYYIKKKGNKTSIERPDFKDPEVYNRAIVYCREVDNVLKDVLGASTNAPPTTTPARSAGVENNHDRQVVTPSEPEQAEDVESSPRKRMRVDGSWSYWDSKDARQLFTGVGDIPMTGSQLKDIILRRIKLLKRCQASAEAWRDVVLGGDPEDLCTENDRFVFRQRAMVLARVYEVALDRMGDRPHFGKCCEEVIEELAKLELCQARNPKTIESWNRSFRVEEGFPNPRQNRKGVLPPLLRKNPDAVEWLEKFCAGNLHSLTVHSVREYLLSHVIPPLYESWKAESGNENKTDKEFLQAHQLTKLAPQTVYNWMRILGMTYDPVRKTFYVDGHERDDVKKDRSRFTRTYLLVYEPRCRRWIQVTVQQAKELELQEQFGFHYKSDDGTAMIEYHEDYFFSSKKASDAFEASNEAFPQELSVRRPPGSTELVIFGQDETVFSQNTVRGKFWTSSKGKRVLLPKSTGYSYMISAFQSRKFGFGMEMTAEELQQVNDSRKGTHYWDAEAANEVQKSTVKKELTKSPFVRTLLIGANLEGYWNSFHMAVQLEDCIDCLKVLHPNLDYVFLFDHSQGHNRKRKDGLDTNGMNKLWGGKQPPMRESKITEGCLGTFPRTLQPGDVQQMCWPTKEELTSDDIGPFHLTPGERVLRRDDIFHDEWTEKDKPLPMLIKEIREKTRDQPNYLKNGDKTRLNVAKLAAIELTIPLKYREQKIDEGWCGKPKGLLQILWERGLIDESKWKQYTVRGTQNKTTKEWNTTYSLRRILSECEDFVNERTHLQVMADAMGVMVDFTPKFHPELAGEGIEYSWGHAKNLYTKKPFTSKKTKDGFVRLVHECLETTGEGFTMKRIRRMSSRARAYICTYRHIELEQNEKEKQQQGDKKQQSPVLLLDEINKLMKKYKTHRCAFDFDTGFVHDLGEEDKPKRKRKKRKKRK